MAKNDDRFEMEGEVIDVVKGGKFIVRLDRNGMECIATLSGKMRINNIHILRGDHVTVDLSANDPELKHARITWRAK